MNTECIVIKTGCDIFCLYMPTYSKRRSVGVVSSIDDQRSKKMIFEEDELLLGVLGCWVVAAHNYNLLSFINFTLIESHIA